MADLAAQPTAFAYRALNAEGRPIAGTLDAADLTQARSLLAGMGLQLTELQALQAPMRPAALRGADLQAFNEQLAYLTQAGLPVERGLRLIASEMRHPRLAQTIRRIAEEAERGVPLAQAFAAYQREIPPLYGRLVQAGIQTGNLPAMLFNLGRHLELVQRLRAALWRAFAYPLMVMVGLVAVLIFLGIQVFPGFAKIYEDFGTELPAVTVALMAVVRFLPVILIALLALCIAVPVTWGLLKANGRDQMVADALGLPMPLIGPVLRRSLIARWCDAVRVAVEAGLDLPQAIALGAETVGSPAVTADTGRLMMALRSGRKLTEAGPLEVLTESVTTAMDLACDGRDLPATMQSLAGLYEQQAETRLSMVGTLLFPILLIFMAIVIGTVISGLFLPLIRLMTSISGGFEMYGFLRIIGVGLAGLLYGVAAIFVVPLALGMLLPYGWPLWPFVAILLAVTLLRLRRRRVLAILEHLRAVLGLNLPLPPALDAASRSERGRLSERLRDIGQSVQVGRTLAQAVDESVPEMSPRDRSVLRAAEGVGRLPQAINRLARLRRAAYRVEDSQSGAVWGYPTILITMMCLLLAFILIFIVPRFTQIFNDFGTRLPAITVMVLNISHWLTGGLDPNTPPDSTGFAVPGLAWIGMVMLLGGMGVLTAWRLGLLRAVLDTLAWHLPIFHGVERDRGLGDVCHILIESLDAGLPIDRALTQAAELNINRFLRRRVGQWARGVSDGLPLDQAARDAQLPPLLVGILATGQAGADLKGMFRFLGRHFDTRFSRAAAILRGAWVPAVVLSLAIVEGTIIVSLFLPLVALIQHVSGIAVRP